MYTLHRETEVDASLEAVWDFIRHPRNLDRITPDDMAFRIVSDVPERMYDGLIVEYRVKIPFVGWQTWVSELKHIRPMESFVDEQKIGPYRFWYHEHRIEAVDDGRVRIIDHISYAVPFGIAGRMAHALMIRPTLERIFRHRESMFRSLLSA
jgi:ligand-binding SRPBCC domain-containing protein